MINIKTFRKNERGQYLFESYKKILADIAREIFLCVIFFENRQCGNILENPISVTNENSPG